MQVNPIRSPIIDKSKAVPFMRQVENLASGGELGEVTSWFVDTSLHRICLEPLLAC